MSASVSLDVRYLEGARVGEELVMEAHCTKVGKSLAFTEGRLLRAGDRRVLATCVHVKALLKPKL